MKLKESIIDIIVNQYYIPHEQADEIIKLFMDAQRVNCECGEPAWITKYCKHCDNDN